MKELNEKAKNVKTGNDVVELIKAFKPLIISVSKKYSYLFDDFNDAMQQTHCIFIEETINYNDTKTEFPSYIKKKLYKFMDREKIRKKQSDSVKLQNRRTVDPFYSIYRDDYTDILTKATKGMSPRDRDIFFSGKKVKDLADYYNLSRTRVYEIIIRWKYRIRRELKKMKITKGEI